MDYQTIADHFLVPKGDEPAEVVVSTTPARRLRDAVEPIATIGWWSRSAAAASVALGHDFFDGYVWGRAAALGADVAPSVVVAAFGVFSPQLLVPVLDQGKSLSTRDAVLAARAAGASNGLRDATASVPVAVIAQLGDRLLHAVVDIDAGSRPLFGALQALPLPDGPYGRLWRAAELVREHRGDGHLAACTVAGLDMAEMNVLTEVWLGYGIGAYSATRGFSPEQLDAAAERLRSRGWFDNNNSLTATGSAERTAIEAATDRSQDVLIQRLGDELNSLVAAAQTVNIAILAAHAAPADPRKRAAG
jgi:hypothetical protein